MNCILYSRIAADKKERNDIFDHMLIEIMIQYAEDKGWTIADYISDEDESVKSHDEAKLKNLRKYLKQHNDIDVAIVALGRAINSSDYAALKFIFDREGIGLILLQITGTVIR